MNRLSLAKTLTDIIDNHVDISDITPAAGGCINKAYFLSLKNGSKYFLKSKPANLWPGMYQAEAHALSLLAQTNTFHIPKTLASTDEYLLLEYFQAGERGLDWQEVFGRTLALMHLSVQKDKPGFEMNTYLGASLQNNQDETDWIEFWRNNRLEPQISLLSQQYSKDDRLITKGKQLLSRLDNLIDYDNEPAVLLHGDLWAGNTGVLESGKPVIFDPASYYGNREAEFGIMRMFGGFNSNCEAAYQEVWPFNDGYELRFRIYQLYHELNHLNLFGTAYYQSSLNIIKALV